MVQPLGSTGITLLLRYYGPLRLPAPAALMVIGSHELMTHHQPWWISPEWASRGFQAIFRRALSPITPAGTMSAFAHYFLIVGRLRQVWVLGRQR